MNRFIALLGPVISVIFWAVVSKLNIIDPFFLPHPRDAFWELLLLTKSGVITQDILATGIRLAGAFGIAIILGIPTGLFLGNTERVYRSVEFILDFVRSTPATAIFPLFLIIFGIGDASKIAAAAVGALVIIIFNTAYGVIHSQKPRLLAARVMGASKWQIFRWIIFWESLPQTFVGLRNAASFALLVIVVTEMFIGTNVGLGRRIVDSQIVYNIRAMYAAIITTGVLGYAFNYALLFLEKRYVHWSSR